MEENLKKTIEYIKNRIKEIKSFEDEIGGFDLYDEGDICLYKELDTLEKVLKMLEGS